MSRPYDANAYRARFIRAIDGDTVHLEIDLGLRVSRVLDVRLIGINAPEMSKEKERAIAARDYLKAILNERPLVVQFAKGKSFDRWLGRIFVDTTSDGGELLLDVQAEMIRAGHAVAFAG
jgi:endonuclease YncB( thermonuclease family)